MAAFALSGCALSPGDESFSETDFSVLFSGYTDVPGGFVKLEVFDNPNGRWRPLEQRNGRPFPVIRASTMAINDDDETKLYEWRATPKIPVNVFLSGPYARVRAMLFASSTWTPAYMFSERGSACMVTSYAENRARARARRLNLIEMGTHCAQYNRGGLTLTEARVYAPNGSVPPWF